jgi:hypothetical protein
LEVINIVSKGALLILVGFRDKSTFRESEMFLARGSGLRHPSVSFPERSSRIKAGLLILGNW